MKVLLIFLSLAVAAFGQDLEILEDSTGSLGINEQIAKALENLKKQMPCGFPEQGIPPLSPYKRTYLELQYKHALFSILGNFFDLRIDGFDNFRNDGVTFSVLSLKGTFDLNFNKIAAGGDYILNFFPINIMRIKGEGNLDFRLADLRIKGDFKLGLQGKGLALKSFNVVVVLGDCKSNISGLLGGGFLGKVANKVIESFVKFFVKTQANFISKTIRDTIVPMANESLQKLTIKDILNIIASSQKPSTCIPPESKLTELLDMFDLYEE